MVESERGQVEGEGEFGNSECEIRKGGIWRVYRLGIADDGSCLEELDDELFFFDFTALRFSHSSSLRGRSPAFSRSVLFLL